MKDSTKLDLAKFVKYAQFLAAEIRQDGVDAVASGDHVTVIKHFNDLRIANEDIKICREALQEMADVLSTRTIPDIVRDLKERTGEKPPFNIEGVGRVSVSHRWSASILDKPLGYAYLVDNDWGNLITETVNAQTLASHAKSLMEDQGIELPPDLFKTGQMPYTSITKAK